MWMAKGPVVTASLKWSKLTAKLNSEETTNSTHLLKLPVRSPG